MDFFLVEPEFESGFEVLGPRHLFEGRGEGAGEGEGEGEGEAEEVRMQCAPL